MLWCCRQLTLSKIFVRVCYSRISSYAKTKYIKVRRHKNVIYNDFGYLLSYSQSCVIPIFVKWSGSNNSIFVSVCFGRHLISPTVPNWKIAMEESTTATGDSCLDNLDWGEYHDWIRNVISHNKITINDFLQLCHLPLTSYYKQLCCRTGYKLTPSTKPESVGHTFLMALKNLRSHLEERGSDIDVSDDCLSILESDPNFDMVDEFYVENMDSLKSSSVVNMYLDDDDKVRIEMLSDTNSLDSDTTSKLSTLIQSLRIGDDVQPDVVYVPVIRLSHLDCVGILARTDSLTFSGTATPVLLPVHARPVCAFLTAAHTIKDACGISIQESIQKSDQESNQGIKISRVGDTILDVDVTNVPGIVNFYLATETDSHGRHLAEESSYRPMQVVRIYMHVTSDVAIIIFKDKDFKSLPFRYITFPCIWDRFSNIIANKDCTKNGLVTGHTTGCIGTGRSNRTDFANVKSKLFGSFAERGDSGSLVYLENSVTCVGMVCHREIDSREVKILKGSIIESFLVDICRVLRR